MNPPTKSQKIDVHISWGVLYIIGMTYSYTNKANEIMESLSEMCYTHPYIPQKTRKNNIAEHTKHHSRPFDSK